MLIQFSKVTKLLPFCVLSIIVKIELFYVYINLKEKKIVKEFTKFQEKVYNKDIEYIYGRSIL